MQTQSCFLWGLNPSSNDYFLKRSVSRKNGLVLGSCFGILNRWDTGLLASIIKETPKTPLQDTYPGAPQDWLVYNSALSLPPSRQILMGAAIVWQHCAIACCCMSAMLELLHGRVFQSPCNEVKRMLLLGQVTARTRQKLWLYS